MKGILACFPLLLMLSGPGPSGCSQQSGIEGRVLFESGNQMPGPGVNREPAKGVAREVLVYPALKMDELSGEGNGFYKEPDAKPLETVESKEDGTFSLKLKPGKYSVFVREKGMLYANLSDGEGYVFPVEVEAGKMTPVEFKISYSAYY